MNDFNFYLAYNKMMLKIVELGLLNTHLCKDVALTKWRGKVDAKEINKRCVL